MLEKLNSPSLRSPLASGADRFLYDTCRGVSLGAGAVDKARSTVFNCNLNISAA